MIIAGHSRCCNSYGGNGHCFSRSIRYFYFTWLPWRSVWTGAAGPGKGVLDANLERIAQIKRRIAEIERGRSDGLSYREIVEAARSPLLVQLITESTQALDGFGARVRRAEARPCTRKG